MALQAKMIINRQGEPPKAQPQNEKLVLEMNRIAVEYLKSGEFAQCLELLRKVERLLEAELDEHPEQAWVRKLQSITYNNLACYYKKTSKPKAALSYLRQALQIQTFTAAEPLVLAQTHLNMCVTLSQLAKHELAKEHAVTAIALLSPLSKEPLDPNLVQLEIVSRYNLGAELQHLRIFDQALEQYTKGYQFGKKCGSKNPLVQIMKNLKSDLQVRLYAQEKRQNDLSTRRRQSNMRNHKQLNQINKLKYIQKLEREASRRERVQSYRRQKQAGTID